MESEKTFEGYQRVVLNKSQREDFQPLIPTITCEAACQLWERFQVKEDLKPQEVIRLMAHLGNPEEKHTSACVSAPEEAHLKLGSFFWDPQT